MNNLRLMTAIGAVLYSTSTVALAQTPDQQPDGTWISLSGSVESVERNSFVLDYGRGFITVEMDDGDRDADAYALLQGDNVIVNGMIDDDLFETTTIEARSIFVESISAYFVASPVDDETARAYSPAFPLAVPVVAGQASIHGSIVAIDPDEQEIVLDTGLNTLVVELDDLPYDPFDDEGYFKLDLRDKITVSGSLSDDFFEGHVFEGDYLVSINR
ncbi:MAG: hypothetical protein CMQ34_06450 [Gammaproteobacteria bacterium]|nr:hypothetical protein [Gammaproteobacteria bacterium]